MATGRPLDIPTELIEAFEHSGAVSEYLVGVVPAEIWRAAPPAGRGRSIAAIASHMQSVRRTFARMAGAHSAGASLDRHTVTKRQAQAALRASTVVLSKSFTAAFASGRARVKGQPRRAVNMLIYLVQHDAHHRGQISALVRDLGHDFSKDDIMRIWGWQKLPER
jgi:uncharacterized damage-inducible protein DinB